MSYASGSLVKTRGREWIVLPESNETLLLLRPLGGTDDEITGIVTAIEQVEPASFAPPDTTQVGDHRSGRLLRDAIRLSSRAGAGPFRSFARIAVEPKPYQLVPLLMALKLDPIRILIADDVGIGKTVEACLIARELLDRGEINTLAVLSPPHLAEQWVRELNSKFNIDAQLVVASTASRLERHCGPGQSLFDLHPFVVVSMDFIKSERRTAEFIRTCPEMVIVDEAHTCAYGFESSRGKHLRYQLVKELSKDTSRHIVLVTATPHTGKDENFRSLLSLMSDEFLHLPDDLSGAHNEPMRRKLAGHLVQRRRGDIRQYLDETTRFPVRESADVTYQLSKEYALFLNKVIRYTQEFVSEHTGDERVRRVRWWSALALLRSVSSSPAAAAETLRNRAPSAEAESAKEADEIGRETVLDGSTEDLTEGIDITPGSDTGEDGAGGATGNRAKLLTLAREADKLFGEKDTKLAGVIKYAKELLAEGYSPIVFCRYIPTANYVAEEMAKKLKGIKVVSITGILPPEERESRIEELAQECLEKEMKRVLVCTDCLSEGINLQDHFDAVIHYDLAWSPTRHEQREGRVDRFGQPKPTVRVITYYGKDNPIDGIVLDILIKKHKSIRDSLGITVSIPTDTNTIVEAVFEGLMLRKKDNEAEQILSGLEDFVKPKRESLFVEWEKSAAREKKSRTMFAHETIKVDELRRELAESRDSIGTAKDVERFAVDALTGYRALITKKGELDTYRIDTSESPRALRDQIGIEKPFTARFEMPVKDTTLYLHRTNPVIEGIASYLIESSLDPLTDGIGSRAGVIFTRSVAMRTTVIVVRYRYDIITKLPTVTRSQIAEECRTLAFEGSPESPRWLTESEAETILGLTPDKNTPAEIAKAHIGHIVSRIDLVIPHIEADMDVRAKELLDAHCRVRTATKTKVKEVAYEVRSIRPVDIIGTYLYLPVAGGAAS